MLLPQGTVFALVDGEQFELYHNVGLEAEPRLAKIRQPVLKETNKSTGVRRQSKTRNPGDDQLDENAHAIAVIDWLNAMAISGSLEKLVIAADPRSLGEMRKRYHKKLKEILIGDLDRTLAGAPVETIVKIFHNA